MADNDLILALNISHHPLLALLGLPLPALASAFAPILPPPPENPFSKIFVWLASSLHKVSSQKEGLLGSSA